MKAKILVKKLNELLEQHPNADVRFAIIYAKNSGAEMAGPMIGKNWNPVSMNGPTIQISVRSKQVAV